MNTQKKSNAIYWILVVAAIISDQISKVVVMQNFSFAERLTVIPGFFDLTLVFNTGAAFGFLANAGGWQKYFFIVLAVVISCYLLLSIVRGSFGTWGNFGAAMVVGGAVGNVIDRLIYNHVVDFLLFYWKEWHYPAFNIADSFICIGVGLLLIDGFLYQKAE